MAHTKELKKLLETYHNLNDRNIIRNLQEENKNVKEENKSLKKQRTIDELTGLPNKLLVFELLKKEVPRAKRNKGIFSVCYVDIDNFKDANDIYGHDIGDEVINYFANTVKGGLREVDIVARLYGDEFLLVFPDTNEKSAYKVMEKAMNVKPYKFLMSNEVKVIEVNASYGITEFNGSDYKKMPIENIIENLIKEADKKMYEHKRSKGLN